MKHGIGVRALTQICLLAAGCTSTAQNPAQGPGSAGPPLPIGPGQYTFQHRFAEHPDMASIELRVQIKGRSIQVHNDQDTALFARGVVSAGMLTWHAASGQWFIAETPEEVHATEVGGCSEGPFVVDLVRRIFWTC